MYCEGYTPSVRTSKLHPIRLEGATQPYEVEMEGHWFPVQCRATSADYLRGKYTCGSSTPPAIEAVGSW
jgi:hypothetical protein